MIESGFTPAALSLLAGAVGPGVGRGAAMGIYSFLLSVGALIGSVLAGVTGRWLAIDGLIYATLGLAIVALSLLPRLGSAHVLCAGGDARSGAKPTTTSSIIGAGAAGLIAARFAAQLGARVLLAERDRIGGDCTWTGCVPSKSLIRVAKAAHEIRTAQRFGVRRARRARSTWHAVRDYVQRKVQEIYQPTSPEALEREGIEVALGPAAFENARSVAYR